MNGQMRKYSESLKNMSEPVLLSQISKTMDLRGLMLYAKEKGKKVAQLTEEERLSFVRTKRNFVK